MFAKTKTHNGPVSGLIPYENKNVEGRVVSPYPYHHIHNPGGLGYVLLQVGRMTKHKTQ